jgi:transglutaminase-like putative cysteine protease
MSPFVNDDEQGDAEDREQKLHTYSVTPRMKLSPAYSPFASRAGRASPRVRLGTMFVAATLSFFGPGCESKQAQTYIKDFRQQELLAFSRHGKRAPVMVGGSAVDAPRGGPLRKEEERPMLAGQGDGAFGDPPGRRSPSFRPDRITELEGTLGYYEVFTPGITPFKRVSALDGVALRDGVPVLGVVDPARTGVTVEGLDAVPPDERARDRFWGNVVLDFSEGGVVPLPTVSPESRILSLTTEPAVELAIERDGADNLFAVALRGTPGQVRVIYVTDAPRSYFGAVLPNAPTDALADEVHPLPESVQRAALTFARELGVTRGMPMDVALRALVDHFRSFEESKQPPRDTGNIYLDLARGRRGVCRHRVYGFVITAQALGIPSRFVQNEAHAWAELMLPELGWLRLDLGGAARGLEAHASGDRPSYQPDAVDPWPRPRAYEESYSRAFEAAAEAAALEGKLKSGGQTRAAGDSRLKPTLAQRASEQELEIDDHRKPLTLRVTRYLPEVMRGGSLELEGEIHNDQGGPVSGLRVEISLSELQAARAVLLGVTVSDAQGHFRGKFAVPPQLDPADYALVVVTPGDASYRAARAD